MTGVFEPLAFARAPRMKNRFMLAPLTNCQSHEDGRLSDEEFRFLTMRAQGGFGLARPPVTREYLARKGLSDAFVRYMGNWPGFLATPDAASAGAE